MNTLPLIRKLTLAVLLLMPLEAFAGPKIVASIRPVQALVYAVTGENNVPEVLLTPGTSPHSFALKPSQAQMLQDADMVFWIGHELETSLEGPIKTLSANARVTALLDTPGLDLLKLEEDDGHGHGSVDPHVWLSPNNVKIMIDAIRDKLIAYNPRQTAVYTKNAKVAKNRIKLLVKKTSKYLAHTQTVPYMVQHDGFGYIARAFAMNEVGHLQTVPGREPGAKHVSQIREAIKSQGVECLFVEPQFTPALAQRLKEETGIRLGELDAMGGELDLSPNLHVRIIQRVAMRMDECLYTQPVQQ